uniref:Arrestin_C domain-containing protein n=1 Tax=Rhabditophanes sp. KR3021 TaxID=114890 RepID=A0AC35TNJ3_9BILA
MVNEAVYVNKALSTVKAGEYTWPFSFTLPENCPSSFSAFNGKIRYSLTVTANVPSCYHKPNFAFKRLIKVLAPIRPADIDFQEVGNLNSHIFAVDSAISGSNEGKMKLEFVLSKQRYYINDYINFKVKVNNYSRKRAGAINISIRQDTKYSASSPQSLDQTHLVSKVLAEKKDPLSFSATTDSIGAECSYEGILELKAATPDFHFQGGNIEAKTFVVVEVVPADSECFNEKVKFEIPITISPLDKHNPLPSTFDNSYEIKLPSVPTIENTMKEEKAIKAKKVKKDKKNPRLIERILIQDEDDEDLVPISAPLEVVPPPKKGFFSRLCGKKDKKAKKPKKEK